MHRWCEIPEFPGYSVSELGQVRNDRTDRVLAVTVLPRGSFVGFMREGTQYKRLVSRLVAEAFVEPPALEDHRRTFDTPIHLNGDRLDNRSTNLMWRPRWFAVKFHQQFALGWNNSSRVQEIDSGRRFPAILAAASRYGLLCLEIFTCAMHYQYYKEYSFGVWPTGQYFKLL